LRLRWVLERAPWVFSVVPVLLLWEAVGRLGVFVFVPPLTRVVTSAVVLAGRGTLWAEGLRTTGAILAGFGLAATGGVVLGVLMARYPLADAAFGLYVDVFQTMPAAAMVPILVLLFGLGRTSIVATAFLFAFFVIAINVYAGVKQVDRRLLHMASSFGAGEWATVRRVILPAALPLALAGLRMGIGRAVNGAVLGEMLISSIGIGGLMMYYGGAFQADYLYALILLIVGLAAALMGVVHAVEKHTLRWMRSTESDYASQRLRRL